jgi:DNA-binding NarL/FixJ family response regulator
MAPTPRQSEFICLRCDKGLSRKEAAHALGISDDAARNHVSRILKRLGLRSFTQVCTAHGRATMLRDINGGMA